MLLKKAELVKMHILIMGVVLVILKAFGQLDKVLPYILVWTED